MKPNHVKKLLSSEIERVTNSPELYCVNPTTDFTRTRKLSMDTIIRGVIGMGSKSLSNELIDLFDASSHMPTTSAFVQQRSKIKADAFESIFRGFSNKLQDPFHEDMSIFAVDGSDIQIPANPSDAASYFPGSNGQKPYNLLHINALYDLNNHIYTDAIIQKRRVINEGKALNDMVDCSEITNALVIADRGYEGFHVMAHIQEKGWSYLIRVKDGAHGIKAGLVLPSDDCFDVDISLKLTRKQTNAMKELCKDKNHYRYLPTTTEFDYLPAKSRKSDPDIFYELPFRIVRFPLSNDSYETVVTNLDREEYPAARLKELYMFRWGIETAFRDLKYTIGLLDFHSKKAMCIQQEIYARLTMYNFAEMITSHVVIEKKQRHYTYKANFSVAVHMCRLFYHGKTTSPKLEAVIAKNLIPIRPNRQHKRICSVSVFRGFLYRVA